LLAVSLPDAKQRHGNGDQSNESSNAAKSPLAFCGWQETSKIDQPANAALENVSLNRTLVREREGRLPESSRATKSLAIDPECREARRR
jgi:hypothetical protein